MSQQELLKRVVELLNQLGIEYMVVGSVASSLQGEPRSTHDIDLVVELDEAAGRRFIEALSPREFYVSNSAMADAVKRGSMFNLIPHGSGDKVDLWVLSKTPFNKSQFERREVIDFVGVPIKVSSPEDTILAKLRWAKQSGGSDKQLTDALRVYEVQRSHLDLAYLERWVAELGVESEYAELQRRVQAI